MNQDQVKDLLLRIEPDVEEFFVIFSGKSSKKCNGLYKPDSREIIIHNKNFTPNGGAGAPAENQASGTADNLLMYTAIHEYAHHIHFTTSPVPVGPKSHTIEFRLILHELLKKAEQIGLHTNIFEKDADFLALTYRIRTQFMAVHGQMIKEFGKVLIEAETLCRTRGVRFEDYIERGLALDRHAATTIIKMHVHDVPDDIGYENMGRVANISNPEKRRLAEDAFKAGEGPDAVRALVRPPRDDEDPIDKIRKEKRRIERTIAGLTTRLSELETRLIEYGEA
ncbi:MAG: hypothetical protein EA426_19455 [Spirochaetaceae bacterium]|nr:MAG: hypothetical protein EA426_19455 [Spirochaetaceae bacterium]